MILGKIFLFISLVFFIILLSAYFLSNPLTKASNDINYPYILSIKPAVLKTGGTANISFQSSDPVRLLVINPEASQFNSNRAVQNFDILQFPKDFSKGSTSLEGNYTVLMLMDINNRTLASVNFNVLGNPQLASFIDFIFGKGLGFTIGIIVPIIPVIYQFTTQQKEDHIRRLEDQADWIKKSYKYIMDLSFSSLSLYGIFEHEHENKFYYKGAEEYDPYEILHFIIQYVKNIKEFTKHVGYLYLQDYWLENFLYNLVVYIASVSPIDTRSVVSLEFFDHSVNELKSNKNSKSYVEQIQKWLKDERRVKEFYLNHLAHRWILYVEGTRKSLVISPSPSRQKHVMDIIMLLYKDELEPHIDKLNRKIYGTYTEAYYHLYDQRSHRILSIFSRHTHYFKPVTAPEDAKAVVPEKSQGRIVRYTSDGKPADVKS